MARVISFISLFQSTKGHVRQFWRPLLVGIVVFTCIASGIHLYFSSAAAKHIAGSLARMGMEPGAAEEVLQGLNQGDAPVVPDGIRRTTGDFLNTDGTQKEDVIQEHALRAFSAFIPSIIVLIFATVLVNSVAVYFYLVQSVLHFQSAQSTFGSLITYTVPLLGLTLWVSIISLGWVPLVGPVLAIIILPVYALSAYIFVSEKQGIIQSVQESRRRSKRFRLQLLGYGLLIAAFLVLTLLLYGRISVFIGAYSHTLLIVTGNFIHQCALAISTVFYACLCKEILAQNKVM